MTGATSIFLSDGSFPRQSSKEQSRVNFVFTQAERELQMDEILGTEEAAWQAGEDVDEAIEIAAEMAQVEIAEQQGAEAENADGNRGVMQANKAVEEAKWTPSDETQAQEAALDAPGAALEKDNTEKAAEDPPVGNTAVESPTVEEQAGEANFTDSNPQEETVQVSVSADTMEASETSSEPGIIKMAVKKPDPVENDADATMATGGNETAQEPTLVASAAVPLSSFPTFSSSKGANDPPSEKETLDEEIVRITPIVKRPDPPAPTAEKYTMRQRRQQGNVPTDTPPPIRDASVQPLAESSCCIIS